ASLVVSRAGRIRVPEAIQEPGLGFRIFDVEVREGEEAEKLVEIIRERASSSSVRYSILTVMEGSYTRSMVILSSFNEHKLVIESEVFKTLAASLAERVRLREISSPGVEARLAEVVAGISLRQGGGVLAYPSTGRPELPGSGDVYLGELIDSTVPRRLYLSLNDVRGHIGVFGSTGSGKSTTLSVLASRLSTSGMSIVVMDWTGEYEALLGRIGASYRVMDPVKGEAPVNPLLLAKSGEIDVVVDILSRSLGLSQPQEYLLQRVLESSRPDSIDELLTMVDGHPEEAKWDREVKRGLARKLGVMARSSGGSAFRGNSGPSIVPGISIIRCDRIRNASLRTVYILVYLAYLYTIPPRREVVVVIDEAHNVFGSGWGGFPDQLIAESRKYGIYLILATQSPSEASNSVILNTNTKIVHALKSARDKQLVAATLSLGDDSNRLDKLRPGEALVSAPSLSTPVFVKVDPREPPS
ncbi:MAG: ATP-binding protein, partial [Desulfurococcales archaeon]|nr:ATP-binding protein [Desulfurococcales archaeon]